MISTIHENEQVRAINSASSLQRRKLCPGSAKAEIEAIELAEEVSAANPYAEEGQLLHWYESHPEESRKDLTEGQRQALDKNAWLRDQFMDVQMARMGIPADAKRVLFVEREFFLCDEDLVPIDPPVPGHPDRIIYFQEHQVAFIFDSKFGRIEVSPAELNDQLRTYAVQFADEYFCKHIFAAITQPWVAAPNNFHAVEYTKENLPEFKKELIEIINGTLAPDAPRRPSIDACRYCKAKVDCPEAIEEVKELAVVKISEVSVPELEALGPQMELAQAVIDAWDRRIKYIAKTKPDLLTRYYLKEGRVMREIQDAAKAFSLLMDAGGLLADNPEEAGAEFASCCEVSRNQLEILIAKNRDITHISAKEKIAMVLGGQIKEKSCQPTLEKIKKSRR